MNSTANRCVSPEVMEPSVSESSRVMVGIVSSVERGM